MGKGMHTNYPKGTPLFIMLKNGGIVVGKFSDHKSGKVLLEDGQIIYLNDVRSMSIRKLESGVVGDEHKIKWRI